MNMTAQGRKAEGLRKLHGGPRMLVLPNAWDVASARVLEELGYPAIATTSAGVAFALGYPDGQRVSRDEMLEVVARIAHAVRVPVTADMEAGYGTTPADMAETAKAIVNAGGVGLNLEDVTGDTEDTQAETALQVEKIRAIREASASLGVSLVINARTDVYLMAIGPEATRFERTVERLRAYRAAGADCVFAPGLTNRELIEKLVKAVAAPLNILVTPGCPSIPELEKMGVARASAGSGAMRATLGLLRRIGTELKEAGTYLALFEGAIPFAEVNGLLARRPS
ncbi:MAG TPA: isocitrate lyase/phosphoenolpyruvate mutase family protein [Candidatus Acidoferrum sp.]|nr:isocitrate lyase/phosphoenolpyruvate mutase family protein [Candidatus Acidoferrum sp.]